jgi:peptide/nickel transport system substrate-binding protein
VLRGKDTQRISTAVNQKNPIFKDVRVRQAVLGYGIDRPAITKTALLGQAQPLWSFVPPGSRGQIDFGEQFPYDPEKARTLLKEAGYDFQRYVVENMITTSVSSYGHLQAARSHVKGYENLHGYKLRFETTWLDK